MKKWLTVPVLSLYAAGGFAQDSTTVSRTLDSVTIIAQAYQRVHALPATNGLFLLAGKKTEVLELTASPADIANKTARQLFAKVPGVFVYDMDGTGNQVNISARGLDPHRGWEFNNRKDGILINSDMYGYPASHYSMPMESISRIELVRGSGSLQYGAQFGGMINYIGKQGDTTRPFSFEHVSSAGSYNLLSTYNAVGGQKGRLRYYVYDYRKNRKGYRDSEETTASAQAVMVQFTFSPNFSLRAEWARSMYRYRMPGPLTDAQFTANPRQATRTRNYFSPDIHIPSVVLQWQLRPNTKLQLTNSAVLGKRNSILFDKPSTTPDTINATTLQYNNRQVDIDQFNSYTSELRLLQQYGRNNKAHVLAAGIQYMHNDLHRTQLGKGTTGTDYDLSLLDPDWGRDLHFKTKNIAVFAENKLQLSNRFSITAGARVETGSTHLTGTINYYPDNAVPVSIDHHFPLFGFSFLYQQGKNTEWYGGWSQAYRPMLFKDLIPGSLFEKVDPAIRDAKGYNAEIGFRGHWKYLSWDINGYLLKYKHRFGTIVLTDNAGNFITYRTNIGNSLTKGIEALVQADWVPGRNCMISVFTSTALADARYTSGAVKSGSSNVSVKGNKVESAPSLISRNGISFRWNKLSVSGQYSYTSATYADALNTAQASPTGSVGKVPAYGIIDLHAGFRLFKGTDIKFSVNNLANRHYFTKRPAFYPGPGIWPSDGRNWTASFSIRL